MHAAIFQDSRLDFSTQVYTKLPFHPSSISPYSFRMTGAGMAQGFRKPGTDYATHYRIKNLSPVAPVNDRGDHRRHGVNARSEAVPAQSLPDLHYQKSTFNPN